MQGKACFNFSTIDEDVLDELSDVTRRGIATYRDQVPAGGPDGDGVSQKSR